LLDLLAVAVGVEAVDRDAERDDGLAARGVAELGIPGEVPISYLEYEPGRVVEISGAWTWARGRRRL
jgi:hypothetical protein